MFFSQWSLGSWTGGGNISASISKFTPQIHSSTIQPPKKPCKTTTWLRPNLPSIPGCESNLHGISAWRRSIWSKDLTARRVGSILHATTKVISHLSGRQNTPGALVFGWFVGSSVATWWFFWICNNVLCVRIVLHWKRWKWLRKKKFTKWMISLW